MIKSAALFARAPLHLHIFTEIEMKGLFEEEVSHLHSNVLTQAIVLKIFLKAFLSGLIQINPLCIEEATTSEL